MNKNNLALGGLFAALHLIFLFFSTIFFGSEIILIIFLPLISSLYTLKTDLKSTIVFALSTIFLCIIFNPINTLIYIIPSLMVGIVYGFLNKNKIKELSMVYITTLFHFFALLFTIFIINTLFIEFDLFIILQDLFNTNRDNVLIILVNFLILLSIVQSFSTHLIAIFSFIIVLLFVLTNSKYISSSIIILIMFILPYIVEGILNYKYVKTTYLLMFFSLLIFIFTIGYINPIYYPLLMLLIFLPFCVNLYNKNT